MSWKRNWKLLLRISINNISNNLVASGHCCQADAQTGSVLHDLVGARISESIGEVGDGGRVAAATLVRVDQSQRIQSSRLRVRRRGLAILHKKKPQLDKKSKI